MVQQVLGLEMTASCENGQKWTRPPTPNLISSHIHHVSVYSKTEKKTKEKKLLNACFVDAQIHNVLTNKVQRIDTHFTIAWRCVNHKF